MESFRRRCARVRLETRHGAYESIPSDIPPDGTRNPRQRRSRFLLFSPDMHIPTIAEEAIVLAGIERMLCMKCLLSRTVLHIVIQQIGGCLMLSKTRDFWKGESLRRWLGGSIRHSPQTIKDMERRLDELAKLALGIYSLNTGP